MSLKGEYSIFFRHALAIIGHSNQLLAASFYIDADFSCAGIERILNDFLYDRYRTLDDFACGNFINNSIRQNLDDTHTIKTIAQAIRARGRAPY